MNQSLTLEFYNDPSHGWVKVSFDLLNKLNLVDKISGFSYVSHYDKVAYLEEDCDASLLHQALKKNKIEYTVNEHNTREPSFIRRLQCYEPNEVNA